MYKILAKIISIALHPLLMATLLVVILYYFAPTTMAIPSENFRPIVIMVFSLTYIIPLIAIGLLRITSSISSFSLMDRKERIMPFSFITIYYGLTTYLFSQKLDMSDVVVVMFTAITMTIFLVTFFTIIFKISAHAAGIAGLMGFLLAFQFKFPDNQLFWPNMIILFLWGCLSSARLMLNAHTPKEVHFGSLLGFIVCFGSIYIFVK